jgi:hypothetical protein
MRLPTPLVPASCAALAIVFSLAGCGDDDPAATASFAEPTDGATVHGTIQLAMTADGITIEEAGEARDGAGHFHVLADQDCLDEGASIGKDADTVHFGGGQTEGTITLGPGDHDLCLQVGDGVHTALDVTDSVSVTVAIIDRDGWCAVMDQLDQLIEATEISEDDFAAQQIGWENVDRLAAQLLEGIDQVDADAAAEVTDGITGASRLARAVTQADNADDARSAIDAVFESLIEDGKIPGQTWIEDTCGIDLEN